jgi:hypothetical protein
MPSNKGPFPDDGIYRVILWAMVLTVMAGAVLAILGETVFHDDGVIRVGAGVAFVGAAIYAFFRWLGAREAQKGESGRRNTPNDDGNPNE